MKKIFALLSLFVFVNSAFAEQVTTNRYWKELNDRCKSKISTNNYICDYLQCTRSQVEQSYYAENSLWRDGWSEIVTANVYSIYAQPAEQSLSVGEERQALPILQMNMLAMFKAAYDGLNEKGVCNQKMPPELVKSFRGY